MNHPGNLIQKILNRFRRSFSLSRHPEETDEELNAKCFAALSVINLRAEPRYQAALVCQALMGTPLILHHAPKGKYWVNVETPDGCRGWVNDLAIERTNEAYLERWRKSDRLIVTKDYTDFLSEPDPLSQRLSDGVAGCVVQGSLEQAKDGFVRVLLPNGKTAYVPCADVCDFRQWAEEKEDQSGKAAMKSDIVRTAKRFLGIPFLWRGGSVKGFGCGGFAKYVYFLNGYELPYTVKEMWHTGRQLDLTGGTDCLQPGDLVFFGRESDGKRPEIMKHVAIFMGKEMIIHSSHMVRINNVFDESAPDAYVRKILKAVRVMGFSDCGCGISTIRRSPVWFSETGDSQ